MSASTVKGWCPSAYEPMRSGDGLVLRIRPFYGELTAEQALELCTLCETHSTGSMELTSRANLQFRNVQDHEVLLSKLRDLDLLSDTPEIEARRNILLPSNWTHGDLTHRLAQSLTAHLPQFPMLPQKMGYAVDLSGQLAGGSADFRVEHGENETLILRADGAPKGIEITEDTFITHLKGLITWFIETGGIQSGRMAKHVLKTNLPDAWQTTAPLTISSPPQEHVYATNFGVVSAPDLRETLLKSQATHIRFLLTRQFHLVNAKPHSSHFAEAKHTTNVFACAPECTHNAGHTRIIADRLSKYLPADTTLHVSGCSKGCAHPYAADITLVGDAGRFNLVSHGAPWDEPTKRGLDLDMLINMNGLS